VESVAWIAERKDVLSTFFWLLAAWAYVRHTEEGRGPGPRCHRFYPASMFFFALALMSKPMVVTFPFILLLLDYWPLGNRELRIGNREWRIGNGELGFWGLVREKISYLVLAAGVCGVTLLVAHHTGALMSLEKLPPHVRIGYIPVAYLRYLAKTLWPAHLDIYYPYPARLPGWEIAGSAALLALLSWGALARARTRPWLIVGWSWFVGALTPVIGLVQDSNAAMSDHYTYIPIVGLFIMVVWEAWEWSRAWPARRAAWLAGAVVAVCAALTARQVSYWRNDTTLYGHGMAVNPNNYLAFYNMGCDCAEAGDTAGAAGCFQKAVACYRSGAIILTQPDQAFANLGVAFAKQGRFDDAAAQYREALAIAPDNPYAQNGLGRVLEARNQWDEAAIHYSAAISCKPDMAEAHENLGVVLGLQSRFPQAEDQFTQALRLQPDSASIHFNFGNVLLRENKLREASGQYEAVLRLRPDDAQANLNLALAFTQLGRVAEAVPRYREVLRLNPKDVQVLKRLAWLLATDPDPEIRQANEALQLATRAAQLAPSDPSAWDTQAAALAEGGQFAEAVAAAAKALDLAATGDKELAQQIQARLQLYQSGKPFHEAAVRGQ
jgi:tetratricopeptide (TPR) repeat protein